MSKEASTVVQKVFPSFVFNARGELGICFSKEDKRILDDSWKDVLCWVSNGGIIFDSIETELLQKKVLKIHAIDQQVESFVDLEALLKDFFDKKYQFESKKTIDHVNSAKIEGFVQRVSRLLWLITGYVLKTADELVPESIDQPLTAECSKAPELIYSFRKKKMHGDEYSKPKLPGIPVTVLSTEDTRTHSIDESRLKVLVEFNKELNARSVPPRTRRFKFWNGIVPFQIKADLSKALKAPSAQLDISGSDAETESESEDEAPVLQARGPRKSREPHSGRSEGSEPQKRTRVNASFSQERGVSKEAPTPATAVNQQRQSSEHRAHSAQESEVRLTKEQIGQNQAFWKSLFQTNVPIKSVLEEVKQLPVNMTAALDKAFLEVKSRAEYEQRKKKIEQHYAQCRPQLIKQLKNMLVEYGDQMLRIAWGEVKETLSTYESLPPQEQSSVVSQEQQVQRPVESREVSISKKKDTIEKGLYEKIATDYLDGKKDKKYAERNPVKYREVFLFFAKKFDEHHRKTKEQYEVLWDDSELRESLIGEAGEQFADYFKRRGILEITAKDIINSLLRILKRECKAYKKRSTSQESHVPSSLVGTAQGNGRGRQGPASYRRSNVFANANADSSRSNIPSRS